MRLAIISDIHGNIEALDAVMRRIDQERIDRVVCLGDVVGYGASPNECCEVVRLRSEFCLLGNHDAALTGAMDEAYYYSAARHALHWTRDQMKEDNYKWIYGLPYTRMEGELGFYHSAPVMPSGFFYVVQPSEAQAHTHVFNRIKSINFIGHSHLTSTFMITPKKAKSADRKQVVLKDGVKFIVNVGSIGQPRDKDPRACFVIWDSETETLDHIRVEYDMETAAAKILAAGLDEKFAKRLFMGV